jgi:hypothetical protein
MADNYLERQYELLQARKAQIAKRKLAAAKKRARERAKAQTTETTPRESSDSSAQ